ncbi:uncharacterized protein F5147DRAFT_707177 [Suillus discolor]|uniref:Uncharacterized protein n=1 Tax=Suillus discolor TaxID=1912936 RepID=A0A9P7F124_9AGAM|nr:uncharacterized protein F5147DRAFT_707177 [Suillus discolor]KAG2102503.1 hypothetical protein F5147DRAFT_707177 [Suillus discolor]
MPHLAFLALLPTTVYDMRRGLVEWNVVWLRVVLGRYGNLGLGTSHSSGDSSVEQWYQRVPAPVYSWSLL